jgi:hypothetical protein
MFSHEGQSSLPIGVVKEGVVPPRIAVEGAATPASSRNVVVKVDIDLLLSTLRSYGIIDLDGCPESARAPRNGRDKVLRMHKPAIWSFQLRT